MMTSRSVHRRRVEIRPADRGNSFFVDSTGFETAHSRQKPLRQRASGTLIVMIAFAAVFVLVALIAATRLVHR
jgi:hypothetical protein